MADQKTSQLVEATSVADADLFLLVQNGVSKRLPKSTLFDSVGGLNVSGKSTTWKTHETVTSTVALSVVSHTSFLNNSTGSVISPTLGAGAEGFTKILVCKNAVSNISISVPTGVGFTLLTFTAVGQSVALHYIDSSWVILSNNGATAS